MPGVRKRENRENQFYNVGEQGRKTGITLEDRGVRDEYGMEPVSGIFSSPEKSPPKRSDQTNTQSESMDIQDGSIPDLTPGHILRNNRPSLPPPRSRSPMKTSLGATPRRSVGPRQSMPRSPSPSEQLQRDSAAVNRRLDFDQEETSLQETPIPSSVARGNARRNIYEIEQSPIHDEHEELTANEVSQLMDSIAEDSFAGAIDDVVTMDEANGVDATLEESIQEDITIEEEIAEQPRKGRKRKSDTVGHDSPAAPPKKSRMATAQASAKAKAMAPPTGKARPGRPRTRLSDATEEETSLVQDASVEDAAQEEPPVRAQPKPRGRKPKAQEKDLVENSPQEEESRPARPRGRPPKAIKTAKAADTPTAPEADEGSSTKIKPGRKPKTKSNTKSIEPQDLASARLVDTLGKPLSKEDVDMVSTTSAGSRFKRGRALSVFRQMGPEEFGRIGRVGRSGRVVMPPVDFWRNERAKYDKDGNLISVQQMEAVPEEPRSFRAKKSGAGRAKGKKRMAEDDEDEELEDWEVNEGVLVGDYRDFDVATETTSDEQLEATIAWAEKGIMPQQVPNAQFKFTKLGSAGSRSYFSWGCIDLDEDDIKRSKNSRRMHMVFHVTKGAVEVNMNDNVFVVHKGGVWQVPRGNQYSIRNVSKKKSRVFFAQAFEAVAEPEG